MRAEPGARSTLLMPMTSPPHWATPSGVAPERLMRLGPDRGFRPSTHGYSWGNHSVVYSSQVALEIEDCLGR